MVNPMNASTEFDLDQLPSYEFNVVKNLKPGEISEPFESLDENGKVVFKILRIEDVTEAHRANLKDDYEMIEQMALMKKQTEIVENWIQEKKKKTYIHIDESLCGVNF